MVNCDFYSGDNSKHITIISLIFLMIILGISAFVLLDECSGEAMASDGTSPVAYTANTQQNTVSAIDMSNNAIFATISGIDSPAGVAISPNDSRLYVTNRDSNNVTIIDAIKYRTVGTIPVGNMPYDITLSPDGKTAYVTNNQDNTVSIINTTEKKVIGTVKVGNGPYGILANPVDGDVYVIDSLDGTVSVIRGNSVVDTINAGNGTTKGIAVTPDGSRLFVANTNNNSISIINTTSYKVIDTVNTGKSPYGIAISPDGLYAYISNSGSQNISILLISDNTIRVSLNANHPSMMAFKPDGKTIYVMDLPGGNVTAMDSATGETKAAFGLGSSDIDVAMISSSTLVDTMPPVTTLNLNGTMDDNGAFISEVTCNLTAIDYPSGLSVNPGEYSLDGNSWYPYSGNFTLRTPINITVYYHSWDNAGNKEWTKVKDISIVTKEAAAKPSTKPTLLPDQLPMASLYVSATTAPTMIDTPPPSAQAKATSGFGGVAMASGMLGAIYIISRKK